MLLLMLAEIFCLNSCATKNSNICPTYPIAGPLVAKELEHQNFSSSPHFWEWLARINKLRQELELCH